MQSDVIEAMSFLAIFALLRQGACILVLAQSIARHYQGTGELHILPVQFPLVLAPVGMVSMKGR